MEKQRSSDLEDRVVMYLTPSPTFAEELFAAFQKKYPGVKTEYFHKPAAIFMDHVISEMESGKNTADIMLLNRQQMEVLKLKGFIKKYDSAECKDFPQRARDPLGYASQVFIKPFSVAFNTDKVSPEELPVCYEDLLDPKWENKLLYPDPRTSGSASGWYAVMKDHLGEEFFRRLAKQKLSCQRYAEERLAEGNHSILVIAIVDRIEKMKAKGLPVDWILMPIMWFGGPFAVLFHKAKHPNLGKRLIDFLHSVDGQEIIGRYNIPNRPGVLIQETLFEGIIEKLNDVRLVSFDAIHGKQYFKNQAQTVRLLLGDAD